MLRVHHNAPVTFILPETETKKKIVMNVIQCIVFINFTHLYYLRIEINRNKMYDISL